MLVLPTFPAPLELHTRRCVLQQWKEADLAPWAAMNADAEVRRYFPSVLDVEQAHAEAGRCRDAIAQRGWGMWALEVPGEYACAGFVGLNVPHYDAPFVPAPSNEPSRRVMQRLGMARDAAADFDHPRIEAGHPLRRHVLYRTTATAWTALATSRNL